MLRTFLTIFLVTSLSAQPIAWSDHSSSISKSKLHNLNSINLGYEIVDAKENEDLPDESYENLTSDKIIEVIEKLPEVNDIKLDDEKSIIKARKLVTAFNDDSAITNLDKLVAAENKITQLKEEKAKELAAITAIDNLPPVDALTLENVKAVANARQLVNAANNDAAITNLDKLVAAENKISQLKEDKAKEEQRNKELAAITAIDNLPVVDALTLEDSKAVANARQLVKVANNDAAITNLDKLVAVEAKIAELKANNEAIRDDKDNCEDKVDNRNNSQNNRRRDNSRDNSRGGNRGGRNMGHSANRGGRR